MRNTTILVIDGHADTRLLATARLKKHGYDTVFATDAMQAIVLARQTRPDAVLLDLGLPDGNGFVVLEQLRAITPPSGIPVILMTANELAESEVKVLDAGAAFFLRKPVQEEALIAAVEHAVGVRAEGPGGPTRPGCHADLVRRREEDLWRIKRI